MGYTQAKSTLIGARVDELSPEWHWQGGKLAVHLRPATLESNTAP